MTKQELIDHINEKRCSSEENNLQLMLKVVDQFYGGRRVSFKNGPKDVILLGACADSEDYYYIYYNIPDHKFGLNTGCDGIKCMILDKGIPEVPVSWIENKLRGLEESEEIVPFTRLYFSESWLFTFKDKNK